jgi:hypothetical protein
MGFQDYIGESEACAFAGISATTLKRFAEAGYFQIETDADGLRLFSKSEIEKLFGLKPKAPTRPRTPAAATEAERQTTAEVPTEPVSTRNDSAATPASMVTSPAMTPSSPKRATTVVREPVGDDPLDTTPRETVAQHRTPADNAPFTPGRAIPEPVETPATSIVSRGGAAIEALEQEVTKLRNVLSLQEKLLDLREEEVRGLKGERDWLRSRIEKLEEKNERDQLLLLAETQTVRQLINLQQRKRSGVQLALEWLGFKSPLPTPGEPIDISPSTHAKPHA